MRALILAAAIVAQPALAFDRIISVEVLPLQPESEILLPEGARFLDVEIRQQHTHLWVDYSEDRTVPIIEFTICARKQDWLAPEDSEFIGRDGEVLFYRC